MDRQTYFSGTNLISGLCDWQTAYTEPLVQLPIVAPPRTTDIRERPEIPTPPRPWLQY